jgi:hypothetical protein
LFLGILEMMSVVTGAGGKAEIATTPHIYHLNSRDETTKTQGRGSKLQRRHNSQGSSC